MNLEPYDAGFLGGDDDSPTCWWHEYIRSELAAAHDHYEAHIEGALKELAAHTVQGEPVAWLEGEPSMRGATPSNLTALTRSTRIHLTKPSTSNPVWPLYTAPQPAEQAKPTRQYYYKAAKGEACPEGYVMVPVEPTPEWVANLIQVRIDRMESVIEDVLAAAPDVQGELVAWSGWGCQYPGKMPRLYGDRRIAELNCDRENGDQLLHFTAAPHPAEPASPVRQYYYKVSSCKATLPDSDQCICWHDEGEGPIADGSAKHWRDAPAEQQPAPDVEALVELLDLALEYWRDRQQRYKNRRPKWVVAAESALSAYRKGGDE